MTQYQLTTTNFDKWLDSFRHSAIGFDRMFDRVVNLVDKNTWEPVAGPSYPPYNIHKIDKYRYIIELAVAGFNEKNLMVELEGGVLSISGRRDDGLTDPEAGTVKNPDVAMVHRGIANRAFMRRFTLADDVEIKDAQLEDGLLKIHLEHVVPEEKKPRSIPITTIVGDKRLVNGKLLK